MKEEVGPRKRGKKKRGMGGYRGDFLIQGNISPHVRLMLGKKKHLCGKKKGSG